MKEKFRFVYFLFWVRLLVATVAALWIYFAFIDLLGEAMLALLGVPEGATAKLDGSYLGVVLKYLGAVLFWWRAVKVTVLLGSPFSFWVHMETSRENQGESGRPVILGAIGQTNLYLFARDGTIPGPLLYGVISRSHPNSDKVVRNRLVALVMALPFGRSLAVEESRVRFPKMDSVQRAQEFKDFCFDYYKIR